MENRNNKQSLSLFFVLATTTIAILFVAPLPIYAQIVGELQEESEGALTATINGESFVTGDTIEISGTIEDPIAQSFMTIEIIDPDGESLVTEYPRITADDRFVYRFEAGSQPTLGASMERAGNYLVTVTFYEGAGDFDINEVSLEFSYEPTTTPSPETGTTTTAATPSTTVTTMSISAFNDMLEEGLTQVQQLNTTLTQGGASSQTILTELDAIKNTFENIQGNLTEVTPSTRVVE